MNKPNNPFLISGYYGPEYFCDREEESKKLLDDLHNGRNVTLAAPRRMGKTGLIKHVFSKLKEENSDIVTFYMDIFSTQDLADFVNIFAGTVLGKLDSAPKKAMSRVARFIKSCRPVVEFDTVSGTPKFTIELEEGKEQNTLDDIFKYLASSEKRCYIAIDEFQQIAEYPQKNVEALLRSHIQFLPNANFIFSGSRQHLMTEMFFSAKRPFYQSTVMSSIKAIDPKVYYEFAKGFFEKQKRDLPEDIFNLIYKRYEGHTWYIQVVLNRLYSYSGKITSEMVEAAISAILEDMSFSFAKLVSVFPSTSIKLLKAIALEGCVKEPTSGKFISKHNLRAASSVTGALKKLLDSEMIYRTDAGYIVYDRFMAEWIRRLGF